MSLESNLRANIKELRARGMTPAIMNWSGIIQEKAARLYQQRIQTVDLFPTFLLEDCLLLA